MSEICLRYQEVRGDRLVFSCECNGDGCPFEPLSGPRTSRNPADHLHTPAAPERRSETVTGRKRGLHGE